MTKINKQSLNVTIDSLDAPIRLFKFGPNETTKGTFTLTRESASKAIESFAKYGNDLVVDYEHQSEFSEPIEAPASGWIKQGSLTLGIDGLYAKVEWTDRAKAQILAKEYRYFSPTFWHDESSVIVEIASVALTNKPATLRQKPLVLSKGNGSMKKKTKLSVELTALLEAAETALLSAYPEATNIKVMSDNTMLFENAGSSWSIAFEFDESTSAAALSGEPVEVPKSEGEPSESDSEQVSSSKLARDIQAIVGLSGKQAIEAVRLAKSENESLRKQVQSLSDRIDQKEREALIEKALSEGRVGKDTAKVLLSTKDISTVKQLLASMPVGSAEKSVSPASPVDDNAVKDAKYFTQKHNERLGKKAK